MQKNKQHKSTISILGVLLLLAFFFGVLDAIPQVFAAEEELTILTDAGGTLPGGSYILNGDIKLKQQLVIQKGAENAVTIDLNGYVLEGVGIGSVIKNNGHLTIKDSRPDATEHWFKAKEDGPWELVKVEENEDTAGLELITGGVITGGRDLTSADAGSSGGGAIKMGVNDTAKTYRLYFEGGSLVGNSSTRAGGAVYGGTIYMRGGAVIGNYATLFGGGLSLSGSLYMSGGLVERNNTSPTSSYNTKAESGNYDNANVIIGFQSQFEMTGGIIRGNVSTVYNTGGVAPNFDISGGTIEGSFRLLNRLTATFSGGELKGYIYMNSGTCNVENQAWIHGGQRQDGGGVCIRNGTFNMTGGLIENSSATQTGGAIHIDNGACFISGGTISDCSAPNGGAIYMTAGSCTISGTASIQSNTSAQNGGGIYLGNGMITVDGGSILSNGAEQNGGAVYLGGGSMTVYSGEIWRNTAKDSGGAAYIDGGNVKVAGGSITNNTATNNGGGIAVNNGNYKMIGGFVDNNIAVNGAGGGIYVGTDGSNVTVDVLSGSVSNNTAKGNGGAFAVVGNTDSTENIIVNVGVNKNHFETDGKLVTDCEHGDSGDAAYDCPVLIGNKSEASGGGIYVTGNTSTQLSIYCLEESNSSSDGDNGQSNFMKVDGGKVTITTSEQLDEENQTSYHGNTHITNEVYVTGGQMDIWGGMTNPRLEDIITVNITKQDDHFKDHRNNPDDEKYYKLIYFENFTDPVMNITTGQYKEIEVRHGDSISISGNIYSHPGYTIKGWNTSDGRTNELDDYPQGTYLDSKGWYKVGDEKVFDGAPIGDLTIYAIWEANGYTVVYDPNVPYGETYTGKMENKNFTYDLPIKLSKNQYFRPGYDFIGWSKTKDVDSLSIIYKDEEVVTNLTTQKGEVVTLYAQWKVCDHDPATHKYTYSVIDGGKTLKRDCSCGKYIEEARLFAENDVYNKETHATKVVYTSSKWNPVVVYEALDGDVLVEGFPYHAGSYRASITENGCTASVTYTIEKAEQPAPSKPDFDTNKNADGSVMSIKPVAASSISGQDETYTSYPEYRIVYYVDGTEMATDWVKGADIDVLIDGRYAVQFTLDKALTNYYIQARYSGCDNYKVSPASTADSIYFFVGNVDFRIICGDGVKYEIITADGTDVTQNGIDIAFSVKEGYFFPLGYSAVIKEGPEGLTLALKDGDQNVYSITEIPNDSTIVLQLPDAKKNLKVNSAIAEKQVFKSITGNEATISRDSSYTVFFAVKNYCNEEYEELKLCFDLPLPIGTTIIMQDRSIGAYYWTAIDSTGIYELVLTSFVRMGDSEKTTFKLIEGNMDLQFIIDFSQTANRIDGEAVKTTLSAMPKAGSQASAGQSAEVTVLKNEGGFKLTAGEAIGEIVFLHTKSEGATSIWDGRDDALVFKPKSVLPADAHLSIVCGNATTVVYANCDNNFVYSVPDQAEGRISVSLISNLLVEGSAEYSFEVEWIVAKSKAEYSPMNAECVAMVQVNIQGVGQSPISLKIVGDKKLYSLNDTVNATVSWKDLPSNYKLEVILMVKTESGDYSSTAVTQEIVFNTENGTQDISVSLAGNNAGSYRLYISAELGLVTVAEAEYYFIIN